MSICLIFWRKPALFSSYGLKLVCSDWLERLDITKGTTVITTTMTSDLKLTPFGRLHMQTWYCPARLLMTRTRTWATVLWFFSGHSTMVFQYISSNWNSSIMVFTSTKTQPKRYCGSTMVHVLMYFKTQYSTEFNVPWFLLPRLP